MNCRRLESNTSWIPAWHRFWCRECRAARAVDALVARGVSQMRDAPVPEEGLTRTLSALGLPEVGGAGPTPRHRIPYPPRAARWVAVSAGLAMLLAWVALTLWKQTGAAALAETAAALEKVRSIHWAGMEVIRGREIRTEMW